MVHHVSPCAATQRLILTLHPIQMNRVRVRYKECVAHVF